MYELERGSLYGSNGKKDMSSLSVLGCVGTTAAATAGCSCWCSSSGKTYMNPVACATRAN